jgi:hypothetical protein
LKDNILPVDMTSVDQIVHLAKRCTLVEGDLYRCGANGVLMQCITREEGCELLAEVHAGECGNHASSHTLVGKAFWHGSVSIPHQVDPHADVSDVGHLSATTMSLVMQRHSTVLMTECSVAGDKTQRAHAVEYIIGYF